MIHVTGNTATGFWLEFKRNYDLERTDRRHQLIPLAQVDERYVTDTVGNGDATVDTTARDRLESAATVVQPPGRSPKPFDPSVRWFPNSIKDTADTMNRLLTVKTGLKTMSKSLCLTVSLTATPLQYCKVPPERCEM